MITGKIVQYSKWYWRDVFMSLTSMLKGSSPAQKNFQLIFRELLESGVEFKTLSGKETFSKSEYEIKAPNNLVNKYNSGLVGTAFDYLVRIMISRVAKNNREIAFKDMIAEKGYFILENSLNGHFQQKINLSKRFINIKRRIEKFPKNKKHINELINDAIFLAKLEHVFRSKRLPENYLEDSFFEDAEADIIVDLEKLCEVFQLEFINQYVNSESVVIYNPRFGCCSAFVGGADGDVIIDGTLYDLKTVKDSGYKWQDAAQLLGYYLFNELSANICEASDWAQFYSPYNIKRVALYKARFGEVEYLDINKFDQQELDKAKLRLLEHFVNNPSPMNPIFVENYHILKDMVAKNTI